jgi:hypothetical protein
MNAVAKTDTQEPKPLEALEKLRYRAASNFPDPRAYDTFYTKHLHPKRYLDSIGIEVFVDHLLNQSSPKEIAIAYQISLSYILRWVQADAEREKQWEWALVHEADNLMYEARDKLDAAFVPPDKALDKAEKQANHARLMAKGFGQKRWGARENAAGGLAAGASVIYNFNVALLPGQQEQILRDKERVIEHVKVEDNPVVEFDINKYLGSKQGAVDLTIPKEEVLNREEAQAQEST